MHVLKWISLACVVTLAMLIAALPAASGGVFVAKNGNDAWSGTLAQPNAANSDGPLATLIRARDAIREIKATDADAQLTVTVRAGTYHLAEPLMLTSEDSGTAQRPVRWQAHPGEEVILSGGRPITSEWRTADGKIYTTQLPEVADGNWYFRLVRVGEDWAVRARYPNYDPENPYTGGWLFVKPFAEAEARFGKVVEGIHGVGDMMQWRVRVPASGDYNVFHYYAAHNEPWGIVDMGGRTTFSVDEGEPVVLQSLPDTGSFNSFKWSPKNATLRLEKGEHTIRWTNIKGGGINYDAFVLCDDPEWTPEGAPPKGPAVGRHMIVVDAESFVQSKGEELSVAVRGRKPDFGFAPGELKEWPRSKQIEMHVFPAQSWVNSIEPIADLDIENGTGTLVGRIMELRVGNRYFLENIFEELDTPGEWYLDRETGVLHYWPTEPDFAEKAIVAPVHDRIIHIRGGAGAGPVRNIEIAGFTFMDTSYTPHTGNPYGPPDAAIWIEYGRDCLIENCRFTRLGGSALNLVGDVRGNRFLGNTVEYVGQNGVYMYGGGASTCPMENTVAGCHIHHIGLIYKSVGGVHIGPRNPALAQQPGNLIAHNLITDVPRYGIGMLMNQGNNVVEFNEIRRSNLETNDTGGIATCVRNREAAGNVFRFNLVMDSIGLQTTTEGEILTPFFTWGIYLDDDSSHAQVYGNICVRNYRGGVVIHRGQKNVIENNIFVDSNLAEAEFMDWGGQMVGNVFRRNICYRVKGAGDMIRFTGPFGWTDQVLAECDRNLYWNAADEPSFTFGGKSLEQWREMGYDEHTVVADPMFRAPENDDYTLDAKSPAFELGFQAIPVARIGLNGYDRSEY